MNALPLVKKFLKSSGGVDQYQNVELVWQRGHNPDLFVMVPGAPEKRVDLSGYNYQQLHDLFAGLFPRKPPRRLAGRSLAERDTGANHTATPPVATTAAALHNDAPPLRPSGRGGADEAARRGGRAHGAERTTAGRTHARARTQAQVVAGIALGIAVAATLLALGLKRCAAAREGGTAGGKGAALLEEFDEAKVDPT